MERDDVWLFTSSLSVAMMLHSEDFRVKLTKYMSERMKVKCLQSLQAVKGSHVVFYS